MSLNVLIVAAHPDDELLGCGGTAAAYAAAGHNVVALILGEGGTDRAEGTIVDLAASAQKAAKVLGLLAPSFAELPDNQFDRLALLDIIQPVELTIKEFQPTVVLTHHGNDLNQDHRLTHHAVLCACRPQPASTIRAVYCFETLSSTEWASDSQGSVFRPSTYNDITPFLDAKLDALDFYETEMRSFPHPRSREAVRAQAVLRGSQVGYAAAEAFEVAWSREPLGLQTPVAATR